MKTIEASGKSVEKAIEAGLAELGVAQEEVDIKILDEGGLFRKARVQLTMEGGEEEAPVKEKSEEKEEKKINKQLAKEEKKASKEEVKASKVKQENQSPTSAEEKPANSAPARERVDISQYNKDDIIKVGKDFLTKFLELFMVEASVEPIEVNDSITFNINGDKVNELIGRRGETLNAVQEILNCVIRESGFAGIKVYIDVENYKNRREESLRSLADRMANKAVNINKPVRLEPMNAYERKIIHTSLQQNENVTTRSEGEEPNRYLVIIPKR